MNRINLLFQNNPGNLLSIYFCAGCPTLEGTADVYYREYTRSSTGSDFAVFRNFKIDDHANDTESWGSSDARVTVTAYAVQRDGFDTASAAWAATFGKVVNP